MSTELSSTDPSKPVEPAATGVFERLLIWLGIRHTPSIREDIEDALAEAEFGAEFSQREREMLKNVLGLRTNRVHDVMVPRADIVAVGAETPLGDLLRVFRTAGHSRLPVYGETLDDPRGMVHIRDFVDYIAAGAEKSSGSRRRKTAAGLSNLGSLDLTLPLSAAKILRPVLFVPPSMLALDLLVKMQTTRTHMALVIDEYGGTDGLVSIEDLVEIVVGEIEDEHDLEETPMIVSAEDGTHVVDARADLKEVSAVVGVDLSQGEDAEEIETIGGLIGMLAGRVPVRGQIIPGPARIEFEVLDADPRRVKRVRIQPKAVEVKPAVAAKRRRKDAGAEAAPEPSGKPAD
jgi:CBS domain containing-hemolysin-like protein